MKRYKNYIFDQGNVILDIDPRLSLDAFKPLLKPSASDAPISAADLLGGPDGTLTAEYQVGRITTEEFVARLMPSMRPGTTKQQLLQAWNAIIIGIPERRLRALGKLHDQGARTFMLSNTNDEHMRHIIEVCFGGRRDRMFHYFDDLFLSNEMHLAKPGAEIFIEAMRRGNINPEETLFIDDLEQNVLAARKLGIDAMQSVGNCWLERLGL